MHLKGEGENLEEEQILKMFEPYQWAKCLVPLSSLQDS